MLRAVIEHVERHWGRLATTNVFIVSATMLTNIESMLKIIVLLLTACLTALSIYYKWKKNGADKN